MSFTQMIFSSYNTIHFFYNSFLTVQQLLVKNSLKVKVKLIYFIIENDKENILVKIGS